MRRGEGAPAENQLGEPNLPQPPPALRHQPQPPPHPPAKKELAPVHAVDADEEDPPEPQSESWAPGEDDTPPPITDEVYDWRRDTRRGRKSRLNFTIYVAHRLRAGLAVELVMHFMTSMALTQV